MAIESKGIFKGFFVGESRDALDTADLTGYPLHPVVTSDGKQWGILNNDGTSIMWATGISEQEYDGETHTLTITYIDGSTKDIVLPADNFLANASYDDDTGILTFTLVDATTVDVNLNSLVSNVSVSNTDSIELIKDSTSGKISANLIVSQEAGNGLEIKSDGAYVFIPQVYEVTI